MLSDNPGQKNSNSNAYITRMVAGHFHQKLRNELQGIYWKTYGDMQKDIVETGVLQNKYFVLLLQKERKKLLEA